MCRFSTSQASSKPRAAARYTGLPRMEESVATVQSSAWLLDSTTEHVPPSQSDSPDSINTFDMGLLDAEFDSFIENEDLARLLNDDDLSIPAPPPVVVDERFTPNFSEGSLFSTMLKQTQEMAHAPRPAEFPFPPVKADFLTNPLQSTEAYQMGAVALHEMETRIKQNLEVLRHHAPLPEVRQDRKRSLKAEEEEEEDPLEEVKKKRRESAQRSRARKNAYVKALELENKRLREENNAMKLALAKCDNNAAVSPANQEMASWPGDNSQEMNAANMMSLMAMYGLGLKQASTGYILQ